MDEIRVGIIGFGFMGKTHTYGYKTIPLYYNNLPFKIKLVGICNRTLETAMKAKDALDFEFATDDPDDIFGRKDINVVNICTPNIYHKDAVIKALKAGKNVYCEKPLGVSSSEAGEITAVLEKSNLITQMVFQYRFLPATMRAKEIIEEGRIGKIMSFRACYLHSGSVDLNKPIGWKQDSKNGGGVLFDMGSHILDMVYYLLGEYSSVFANTEVIYKTRPDKNGNLVDIDAEDAVFIIAKMKNGGSGTIEASKVATGTNDELRFEIHGDKGAIRFNLMEPNWLEFFDNTLPETSLGGYRGYTKIECVQRYKNPGGDFPSSKSSVGWIRSHVHSLYNFLTHVYEGKQTSPSFRDGAYIQMIMEKAYESDKKKFWVETD